MKKEVKVYLLDIADSLKKIEKYTEKISEKEFYGNDTIQDAVIRRLEIIGEAAKNIPTDLKILHPEIPWRQIAGARDVFIHQYFEVNMERVWIILKKDLRTLKKQIQKLLKPML